VEASFVFYRKLAPAKSKENFAGQHASNASDFRYVAIECQTLAMLRLVKNSKIFLARHSRSQQGLAPPIRA
jgi:hypothetical protein